MKSVGIEISQKDILIVDEADLISDCYEGSFEKSILSKDLSKKLLEEILEIKKSCQLKDKCTIFPYGSNKKVYKKILQLKNSMDTESAGDFDFLNVIDRCN